MYKKILVPLDGSDLAECVLPHAETIAKAAGVEEVVFVRVAEPTYMPARYAEIGLTEEDIKMIEAESREAARTYLDKVVGGVDYGRVKVSSEVLSGKAAERLADYVARNNVDLIIIATHGRSGVSRWMWGSVADRILHSSTAPVMMVRSPGCAPGN